MGMISRVKMDEGHWGLGEHLGVGGELQWKIFLFGRSQDLGVEVGEGTFGVGCGVAVEYIPHTNIVIAWRNRVATLDITSAYNQIPIKKEDIPKIAFVTKHGLWEHTTMSFGLCNAPATFQRIMELALRGMHLSWQHYAHEHNGFVLYLTAFVMLGWNSNLPNATFCRLKWHF